MAAPSKYLLRVTAGPTYTDQSEVEVNTEKPYRVSSKDIEADITIRIKDFRGIPHSPSTSPYFTQHSRSSALYSIQFSFTVPETVSADDLVFGNDFDHPIRDSLPPFFGQAFGYVKKWIDPGIEGDPYADAPYLYGRVVGSVNTFAIGRKAGLGETGKKGSGSDEVELVDEGAEDEEGEKIRKELKVPATGSARQKFFLTEEHRKALKFEKGRVYKCDFFNGYLDFNDFALRLPLGLSFNIVKYWDGQPLRYVLRNQKTNTVLFAICFTLVPTDEESKAAMEKQTGRKVPDVVKHKDADATKKSEAKTETKEEKEGYADEGVD